jgi:heme-degrading monooxygenase HmoA
MIARIWHGTVPTERASEYHAYLLRTGIPDYRKTPGNRGVQLLSRSEGMSTQFFIVTLWEDMEAIRAFAGPDVERARYYPEDDDFLLHKDPFVTHFEVLGIDGEGSAAGLGATPDASAYTSSVEAGETQ